MATGTWVKAEAVSYLKGSRNNIGIEIFNNKGNALEKIFGELGYKIIKLDRVSFAGITKKKLARSEYRELSATEVQQLKMLG